MAPLEVIQHIEHCCPTLESKTSWSLRSSLSRYNVPHSQVAVQAEPVHVHGNDNTNDPCTSISSKTLLFRLL